MNNAIIFTIKEMSERRIFEIAKKIIPRTANARRMGVLKLTMTKTDHNRKIISFTAPHRE